MKKSNKDLAIAILAEAKPKKKEEPEKESEEEMGDHEAMAQEIIDAVKAGDASGLAESLKSFYSMCSMEEAPEE